MKNYDVIFIGGSLMASSTAFNLLSERPDLKILMIEKDPTYKHAATPLALGGIRQQFTERTNIRMAKMSVETFENFGEIMETKTFGKPNIDLRQGGYLFLVNEDNGPPPWRMQRSSGLRAWIFDCSASVIWRPCCRRPI